MKEILERLWDEHLFAECAAMDTDEERALARTSVALHEKVRALLNKGQEEMVESYVDALCDMEAHFIKKAFFKGCEFAITFLLTAGKLGE